MELVLQISHSVSIKKAGRFKMQVAAIQMTLIAPDAHSLKDKRQIVRSVIDQTRRRFNVSISEVDALDLHQRIMLGLAVVSTTAVHARTMLDEIIRFVEDKAEIAGAECTRIETVL